MSITKIEISEDNGFMYDGVPTLVVVSVYFDDGKYVRFPHLASSTISELYSDLNKIPADKVKEVPYSIKPIPQVDIPCAEIPVPQLARVDKTNEIEKGDTVRCVKLGDRGEGATVDLHTGGMYRVLAVHKKSIPTPSGEMMNIIDGYDVIDDKAATPIRAFVFNGEIELVSKHAPFKRPVLSKEVDLSCPQCSQKVYCGLTNGFYSGVCDCGQSVTQSKEQWDKEHPAGKVSA